MADTEQLQTKETMTTSRKAMWTIGNLLMLIGLYLILFVGGLMADEQYNVYAASGANDEIAPMVRVDAADAPVQSQPVQLVQPTETAQAPVAADEVAVPVEAQPAETSEPVEAPVAEHTPEESNPPSSNNSSDDSPDAVPSKMVEEERSIITRIVIPEIAVDRKVVEVGWTLQQDENGQTVAVWDVDQYRVGHHKGSSNPGGGSNIVLSGHSGGTAYPFNDLYYLEMDDLVQLYNNEQVYEYAVSDWVLLDEIGQPLEKRLENARYIEPTDEEMITMVACWPLTGPDRFTQRIVVRAKPVHAPTEMVQTSEETTDQTTDKPDASMQVASPTPVPTTIPTPVPTVDPALTAALDQVAQAERALQSGQIEAVTQQQDGVQSSAIIRFDLGDEERAARLRSITTMEGPDGATTTEYIIVGDRVWEHQPDNMWTETSDQPSVMEQMQALLPDVEAATAPEVETDGTITIVRWYDPEQDADITVHLDASNTMLHELQRVSRKDGSVLSVTYSSWNTFVDILSPEGT
jgi:sortase A